MQPYLFPYIGYFQLMNLVDSWVIFNDVQFVNKGWVNRNRILHPDKQKEWQYITIPIARHYRFRNIKNIKVDDNTWKETFLRKLSIYRKCAPYYQETIKFIKSSFNNIQTTYLSEILENSLKQTAYILDITPSFYKQSDLPNFSNNVSHPGQWALRISEYFEATAYFNPAGGSDIFFEDEFINSHISLKFVKPSIKSYNQDRRNFVPSLSIIDVLMWNGIEEAKKMAKTQGEIIA